MTLREATFSSTRWTTAASLFRASLQLVQTMVLARLLMPADFGLMAMASIAITITALFADFGLSSALMHFPRPERNVLSTLYWLSMALACLLALLSSLLAWPAAHLLKQPALGPILCWLSLSFPLSALGQLFRVLAEKELRFQLLARQEVTAALFGFIVALAVAFNGGGVFALVAASLTSTATSSILAWWRLSAGARPQASLSMRMVKPFIGFGLHRMGDNFWNTLQLQADVFIAGLIAAPAAVAVYAIPREQCLRVANTIVNPIVTRIGLPIMTRLQNNSIALRSVYLQTLRMTASVNFPIYALLALYSEEIVDVLLGAQWHDSAFYLRIFSLWCLIRSTGNPSGSLIYAVGLARRAHLWNFTLFLAMVPLLWMAARFGDLTILASTMLAMQVSIFALAWRFLIWPACGASFMEYCRHLAPPFCSIISASIVALATTHSLAGHWKLSVGLLSFGAAYLTFSWWMNRRWAMAMIELLNPFWRALR